LKRTLALTGTTISRFTIVALAGILNSIRWSLLAEGVPAIVKVIVLTPSATDEVVTVIPAGALKIQSLVVTVPAAMVLK
jgi:hypothetical protein